MLKKNNQTAFKRNVRRALPTLFVCVAFGAATIGCQGTGSNDNPPEGFRITKFVINNVEGIINQNTRTIGVTLPYGTEIREFEPKVEFVGVKINPAPETSVDFTKQPVKYTVFSKDGSAFVYLVTVTIEIPNDKEIRSFELDGVTAFATDIIENSDDTGVVLITVPYGTDVKNSTTSITINGDSINPIPGAPQDFTKPVTYEVYSLRGEKRTYTVQVTIAPNVENDITRFAINGAEGAITGANIVVTMPHNTDLTSLSPDIETSPESTVSPAGEQDFSNGAITYKVTAADTFTIRNYSVTVKVSAIDSKEISSFTIADQEKSEINGTDITVTLPANMLRDNLTPRIAFAGSTVSPASGAAQDFSNEVTYTVTAEDNTTQDYTVTVNNSAAKDVTFDSVVANGASWHKETTALTLYFSEDMGSALKAEHITLDPATGTITKGTLSHKGSGEYELLVSDIPGDTVQVSVTVAENSVYGFTLTGGAKTTDVYKSPEFIGWLDLKANGEDKTETTTELTFVLEKDVGLTLEDIILLGAGAVKGTLSPSGTTRTLTITGVNQNEASLIVSLHKKGYAFSPGTKVILVSKKLNNDAGLSSLTVNGYTLDPPVFDTNTTDYAVNVISETIQITATANDPKARMVYEENNNATVTSENSFNSKTLNEGVNTVTIKVTAEDGTTTTSYVLKATFSDFPTGTIIENPFVVGSTTEWDNAINLIKNGGNGKNYIITVTKDFDLAGTSINTFGSVTDLTVVIRGSKTITLSSTGSTGNLINVGRNQSLILHNITLKSNMTYNPAPLVLLDNGGEFEMRGGAKLTDNPGGGVHVRNGSTFTMRDNTSVSGNTAQSFGGGVYINLGSNFIMRDNASVFGNTSGYFGGGVCVQYNASFTMRDNASVFGNKAVQGGGVYLYNATFRMAGGTVYGSGEVDGLKNTVNYKDAALGVDSGCIAEHGTGGTDGEPWVSNGTLSSTDITTKVVNGVKQ